MLSGKNADFLKKLADLCDEYNAGFTYTTDDDGTHILVDGNDIFAGYIDTNAAAIFRKALSSKT